MKKINYLFLLSIIFTFLYSCNSETSDAENFESEEAFTVGEILNSDSKKAIALNCGVSGPICAFPNQSLTYTYSSPDNNPNITWTVNSGNISIASGQGTNTIVLNFGSNFTGGSISVIGIGPSNCYVSRNILKCGTPPNDCTIYFLGILDEYIDGTQSGANFVYLHAGGNFPSGTTYAWEIKRQDNSIQLYSASTSNPRLISASINNRIIKATVTAKYEDCIRTVSNVFRCAIPNSDINGDLFPECQ